MTNKERQDDMRGWWRCGGFCDDDVRAMVLLVCGLGVCGVARAASFDCKVAKTDIERAICSGQKI